MPAEALILKKDEVSIFGPFVPGRIFPALIFGEEGVTRILLIHTLPSDQAVDLYDLNAEKGYKVIQNDNPYEMLNQEEPTYRVSSGETLNYSVIDIGDVIIRLVIKHHLGPYSFSLS